MTADGTTADAKSHPVASALADPVVGGRLLAAAHAFLFPRTRDFSPARRTAQAEEIVSTARVRAWQKRHAFDPARDVVSWLVGFVVNVAREHLKQSGREQAASSGPTVKLENLAADFGTPLDALERREQGERLARLLSQLPAEDRELLRLKYEEGLTFPEIGAMRGVDANAVRVRHHRLIGRLRQLCGDSGEER